MRAARRSRRTVASMDEADDEAGFGLPALPAAPPVMVCPAVLVCPAVEVCPAVTVCPAVAAFPAVTLCPAVTVFPAMTACSAASAFPALPSGWDSTGGGTHSPLSSTTRPSWMRTTRRAWSATFWSCVIRMTVCPASASPLSPDTTSACSRSRTPTYTVRCLCEPFSRTWASKVLRSAVGFSAASGTTSAWLAAADTKNTRAVICGISAPSALSTSNSAV